MDRLHSPIRSIAFFLGGAAALRVLCLAAWMPFPGHAGFQAVARILIGIACALALFWMNHSFLLRDGFRGSSLALSFRQTPYFLVGAVLVVPILTLMAGLLWLLAPFHWQPGTLALKDLSWLGAEYFVGNLGEELMFRGYLLLSLQRSLGLIRALFVVSLLFGLFHLPGLSGMAAVKMICTTAIWSSVFGLGFIRTGSLWTATGMHVFGNVMLHHVLGMSGSESILRIRFNESWPQSYDPGFLASLGVTIPAVVCLFLSPGPRKRMQGPVVGAGSASYANTSWQETGPSARQDEDL